MRISDQLKEMLFALFCLPQNSAHETRTKGSSLFEIHYYVFNLFRLEQLYEEWEGK